MENTRLNQNSNLEGRFFEWNNSLLLETIGFQSLGERIIISPDTLFMDIFLS